MIAQAKSLIPVLRYAVPIGTAILGFTLGAAYGYGQGFAHGELMETLRQTLSASLREKLLDHGKEKEQADRQSIHLPSERCWFPGCAICALRNGSELH